MRYWSVLYTQGGRYGTDTAVVAGDTVESALQTFREEHPGFGVSGVTFIGELLVPAPVLRFWREYR